jgi:hypothetical protein
MLYTHLNFAFLAAVSYTHIRLFVLSDRLADSPFPQRENSYKTKKKHTSNVSQSILFAVSNQPTSTVAEIHAIGKSITADASWCKSTSAN